MVKTTNTLRLQYRDVFGSNHRLVDLAASIKQYRVIGAGSRYRAGPL
jgi:hypothetical protein